MFEENFRIEQLVSSFKTEGRTHVVLYLFFCKTVAVPVHSPNTLKNLESTIIVKYQKAINNGSDNSEVP